MTELLDFIRERIDVLREHKALLWWLGSLSLATFVGTLVAVPFVIVRLPADYFTRESRHDDGRHARHPAVRLLLIVLKNVAGLIFLLAGAIMLLTPGQGVLAMLVGIMLLDFPAKYRLERWIIRQPAVRRTVNWIRVKAGRAPLQILIE